MKKGFDIKILYLCVHKRIYEIAKKNSEKIITRKDFFSLLGNLYKVPKRLRPLVLKEMEDLKMMEKFERSLEDSIKVMPLFTDPEENVSEFYKQLKMF